MATLLVDLRQDSYQDNHHNWTQMLDDCVERYHKEFSWLGSAQGQPEKKV